MATFTAGQLSESYTTCWDTIPHDLAMACKPCPSNGDLTPSSPGGDPHRAT